MKNVACRFGAFRFDVCTDDVVAGLFAREFGTPADGTPVSLWFYLERDADASDSGPRGAFVERFGAVDRPPDFENQTGRFWFADGLGAVFIEAKSSARRKIAAKLPAVLHKALSAKYLDKHETAYTYILYGAVLWIIFIRMIGAGDVVLHAGAIGLDGVTFALCGFGGAGKTTLSGWFIKHRSADFMSDDLLPVGGDRLAQPSGTFVHIYPYNAMEDHIWGQMSVLRRAHWSYRKRFLGEKRVCARVSPASIYDGRCESARPLDAIVWLRRSEGPPTVRKVAGDPFVDEHLTVLEREMEYAFRFEATPSGRSIMGAIFPVGLGQAVRERLEALVRQTPVLKLEGGAGTKVAENAEAIERALATLRAGGAPGGQA
jgi:hypothetical protein